MKDIAWILFYLELLMLKRLPFPWVIRVLRGLGQARFRISRRKRLEAMRRMQTVLLQHASLSVCRELVKTLFINLQVHLGFSFLLMSEHHEHYRSLLEVEGWERLEEAIRAGRGAVLLGSHFGIPRLIRWYLRAKGHRVYYLLLMGERPDASTAVGRWFKRKIQTRFHIYADELFGLEDLSVRYMKKALDHLRQNGLVYLAGDGRHGDRFLPFTVCGQPIAVRQGGIALGLMSGAPILPCFTIIELGELGPRLRIQVQEPLPLQPGRTSSEQLYALAAAYVARLETYILQYPTNAFWFFYGRGPEEANQAAERRSPSMAVTASGCAAERFRLPNKADG